MALISSIMLAIILVFTFNVIPESKSNIEIQKAYESYSDFHAEYTDLDKDVVDKLKADKSVTEINNVVNMGNIVDENGISTSLNSYNKDFIDGYGYKIIKGSKPQNENEIVLEEKALKEMGLTEKIGQTIHFTLVKKYKDEKNHNQIFSKNIEFKLVGIVQKPEDYYKDNVFYQVKAFTHYEDNQNILPNSLINYNGILKLNSKEPSFAKLNKIKYKYNIDSSNFLENVELIQVLDDYKMTKDTKFSKNNKVFPMIAATLVIYNIFNIVLIDMTRQIGMLKSIGLSKKNIRLMLIIKSIIVLIIGVVLGILVGIILSYIGLWFVYKQDVFLYISKQSILEPIKMSAVAVFISSIIPIYKSGKISPIEAIRYSDKYNSKNKNRIHYKLIKKIFGLNGEMAYKNVWRNKARTIVSILAISLAGILFIKTMASSNSYKQSDNTAIAILSMGENDINLNHNKNNTDESFTKYEQDYINEVYKLKNVEEVNPSMYLHGFLKSDAKDITDDYKISKQISEIDKNLETDLVLNAYNDNTLKNINKYIEKGNNINKETEDEYPSALIFNNYYVGTNSTKVLKNVGVGDLIDIKIAIVKDGNLEYKVQKIKVSGILNKDYRVEQNGDFTGDFQVILNENDFKEVTRKENYNEVSIKVKEGTDENVQEELEKLVEGKCFFDIESKLKYRNYYEKQYEKNNKIVMTVVSLILLISSINTFCIIKTNIMIRINELSTLRSIGMSIKKIKHMIVKESIIYGILATLVASIFSTYSHYKDISVSNEIFAQTLGRGNSMQFHIPIMYILQFGFITILICVIAAILSTKKLENISITEGLKVRE